jgi:hypothetical protein
MSGNWEVHETQRQDWERGLGKSEVGVPRCSFPFLFLPASPMRFYSGRTCVGRHDHRSAHRAIAGRRMRPVRRRGATGPTSLPSCSRPAAPAPPPAHPSLAGGQRARWWRPRARWQAKGHAGAPARHPQQGRSGCGRRGGECSLCRWPGWPASRTQQPLTRPCCHRRRPTRSAEFQF